MLFLKNLQPSVVIPPPSSFQSACLWGVNQDRQPANKITALEIIVITIIIIIVIAFPFMNLSHTWLYLTATRTVWGKCYGSQFFSWRKLSDQTAEGRCSQTSNSLSSGRRSHPCRLDMSNTSSESDRPSSIPPHSRRGPRLPWGILCTQYTPHWGKHGAIVPSWRLKLHWL